MRSWEKTQTKFPECLIAGFHHRNLQSIWSVIQTWVIYHMVFILKMWVSTTLWPICYKGLSWTAPSILSAHVPHLLYEADRAAALRVFVMNTNERVTETEHSYSPCSSEHGWGLTLSVPKWIKYPFKSTEGQEGRTAGVSHTTTQVPVHEATRSRLRRNPVIFFFYGKIFCPVPSHQPVVEVFSVSQRVWMSHSGYWQNSDLLGSFPRVWGIYVGPKL